MALPTPDPLSIRVASLQEIARLGLPVPPDTYPLVWEPGDLVELRPTEDLERRAAILHLILEHSFGMPTEAAVAWLNTNDLTPDVTEPEWTWITTGAGDHASFVLHLDALAAFAWVLGMIRVLDPLEPPQRLMEGFPDLFNGETFKQWQARTLSAPRDPTIVAAALDLHYCLDWSYQRATDRPGLIGADAIGQRRWALEWSVVFSGPYHDPPGGWEEVDLST